MRDDMENTNWEEVRKNINGNGMDLEDVFDKAVLDHSNEYRDLYIEEEWIHIDNFCKHLIKDFPILKNYEENLYDEMIDSFICNSDFINSSWYDDFPEITDDDGFTRLDIHKEEEYDDYVANPEEWGFDEDDIEDYKETLENINVWREKNKGRDTRP
jgi:hypothetical protein